VSEIAQQFPHAQVTGLDLEISHVQNHGLANCQFVTGNVLQGLPFADESFDFVHQHLLAATLPVQSWPLVVQELARITAPVGWVELLEIGQSMTNPGPATSRYLQWWMELSERTGFDTTVVEHLGEIFQEAGLSPVTQQRIKAPAGQWGGYAGEMLATDMIEAMQAMKQRFCAHLNLSSASFDTTVDALPTEWEEYHTTFHFYLAYGQKSD
jgi:hypothetical protein